jgi:hypothetical protein
MKTWRIISADCDVYKLPQMPFAECLGLLLYRGDSRAKWQNWTESRPPHHPRIRPPNRLHTVRQHRLARKLLSQLSSRKVISNVWYRRPPYTSPNSVSLGIPSFTNPVPERPHPSATLTSEDSDQIPPAEEVGDEDELYSPEPIILKSINLVERHIPVLQAVRTRIGAEMENMVLAGLDSLVSDVPPAQLQALISHSLPVGRTNQCLHLHFRQLLTFTSFRR